MSERHRSSYILRYVAVVLAAEVGLVLISFLTAGLDVRNIGLPLAVWGTVALVYGLWRLAGPERPGTGIAAVKAMRGQAGADPLANYANLQEYKLTKLQEGPFDAEESVQPEAASPNEAEPSLMDRGTDGLVALCLTIAGVLALGLSWIAGRILPR